MGRPRFLVPDALCKHRGACVRALPEVFNLARTPWIDADGASADEVLATVALCPSGALRSHLKVAQSGIDTVALKGFAGDVAQDASNGKTGFGVLTTWEGGTKTAARTLPMSLGSKSIERRWMIVADEPAELLGKDVAPNPQELLMAALNACMTVGYAAQAAMMGIEIKALSIRTTGTLDLRGFLGLDTNVIPGYDSLDYEVHIVSSASAEQLAALHDNVRRTSPNGNNLARAVALNGTLVVTPA